MPWWDMKVGALQQVYAVLSRDLGFSIEDCRSLLALWSDRSRASADVKAIANGHLVRVKEKLAELEAMRDTLSQLVDACSGDQHSECPILRDLAGEPDSVSEEHWV